MLLQWESSYTIINLSRLANVDELPHVCALKCQYEACKSIWAWGFSTRYHQRTVTGWMRPDRFAVKKSAQSDKSSIVFNTVEWSIEEFRHISTGKSLNCNNLKSIVGHMANVLVCSLWIHYVTTNNNNNYCRLAGIVFSQSISHCTLSHWAF